ncbi:hypothetical protein N9176_00360 [bacterium]|nr:hypothetical protein [bacterium]
MEYFEFEKNISHKLENETIAFDVNGLLNDLDKKRKKRRFIIWLWPIGILCMFYITTVYFESNKIEYSKIEFMNSLDNQKGESYSSGLITFDSADAMSSDKKLIDKVSQDKISETGIATGKNITVTTLTKEKIAESKSKFSNVKQKSVKNSPKTKVGASVNNNYILLQGRKLILNSESNNDQETETTFLPIENKKRQHIVFKPVSSLGGIANLKLLTSVNNIENRISVNNNIDCPSFLSPDKNSGIEIVAELSVFKPIKLLSDVSGEVNILTALRQLNEKPLIGFQAGLYLKYNSNRSPFYIFGGANYSRFTEKMDLDYIVTEIDTTIELVSITESELGDTITYIYGEVFNETTTTGSKIRHYTISSFDILLHVGYEFDLNKFSFGVELGLALNISLIANGKFLSSQSEFSDLKEENPFKNTVGLRYDSKLFAAYYLSPRQKIYASLGLNVTPQSFSKAIGQTTQSYKTVGFNIGYGFSF